MGEKASNQSNGTSGKNRPFAFGRSFMGPFASVMGPTKSRPPNDRHVAGLTLLSLVDAEAAA